MKKLLVVSAVAAAVLAVLAFGVGVVGAAPAEQVPTPTMNEINEIARDLWCPLCNGVRLDNCELQACIQMKEVIAQKMVAGESEEQIKAYFVQQYGDVVLGQPSREGFNLIAWVFPILAAVVGIGWVGYLIITWQKRRPAVAGGPGAPGVPGPRPTEQDDEYARRVEREMNQLD